MRTFALSLLLLCSRAPAATLRYWVQPCSAQQNSAQQTSCHTGDPELAEWAMEAWHAAAFPDVMYSFRFGGDIREYFGRYRRRLSTREDIRKHSGMSLDDRKRLIDRF